jgi:hypothetical protein
MHESKNERLYLFLRWIAVKELMVSKRAHSMFLIDELGSFFSLILKSRE